jgi:prepilin-type N-terminal cleavage/methylation domain-containing protein/prepilin-type processing-associated H-X9-DG protein
MMAERLFGKRNYMFGQSPHSSKNRKVARGGFTLIELLIVIAIIAILASILFPVFGRARENARRAACMSNLRQIGLAWMQYTQDYDELLPLTTDNVGGANGGQGTPGAWNFYTVYGSDGVGAKFDMSKSSLQPYLKSVQIFVCPSDTVGQESGDSYASNSCVSGDVIAGTTLRPGKSLAAFDDTARWMLLGEEASNTGWDSTDDAYFYLPNNFLSIRHLEGSNLTFVDGHVKWFRPEKIFADGYPVGGARPVEPGDRGDCP